MPFFGTKPRSWETYLAGIGASGALMASASVLFVIFIGVVTFSSWPRAGSLLGNGGAGGAVTLHDVATPAPAPPSAPSAGLNLARLLGGGGSAAGHTGSSGIHGDRGGRAPDGLSPGPGRVGSPGGSNGGGQPQGSQPAPPSPPSQGNVVSRAVSDVGNTVQGSTESVGNTLGGSSSPGLGGVVGGLGGTLNTELQGLAGNH